MMNINYFGLSYFIISFIISTVSAVISPFDSPEFCSQIITSTCNTTFNYIDELNSQLRPHLIELTETEYFKYFKLDLDKQCKFWNAQHFCATENCAVEILSPQQYNWSKIENEDFKPSKLGKIAIPQPTGTKNLVADTCEDLDYCHIDDDHHCVYVNLLENPERFTGYGGAQSFEVWQAIYSENCFPNTNPMSMISDEKEKCIEKNLFYRVVSGMHASIAVHLSNEYLDPITKTFYPNLKVFMERVGSFNDRLSNIYFNFALVSQSLVKLNKILPLKSFIESGVENIAVSLSPDNLANVSNIVDHNEFNDGKYDTLLNNILPGLESNVLFDTTSLFNPDSTPPNLKDEFRSRFKNISAIMDCVGCDRCRMWGKLQTIGYGTALKILFENDVDQLKFRRIEIVALINTFDRLSKSIDAINNFKSMYMDHLEQVKTGIAQPGQYEDQAKVSGFNFPFHDVPAKFPVIQQSESISKSTPKHRSLPKKIASPLENDSSDDKPEITLKVQFKATLFEIGQALKFIANSYYILPKIIAKISIVKINDWWNAFIGNTKHVYYDQVTLNDQQQYLDFISN